MGRVVEIGEFVRRLDLDDLSIAERCQYVFTDPFGYDCLDESRRVQATGTRCDLARAPRSSPTTESPGRAA